MISKKKFRPLGPQFGPKIGGKKGGDSGPFPGSATGYKICICSVILRELQELQFYFPENFRCNLWFYESENFSDSHLNHIFESENFRFPFSTKNSISSGVKCEKLSFRKS